MSFVIEQPRGAVPRGLPYVRRLPTTYCYALRFIACSTASGAMGMWRTLAPTAL